MLRVQKLELEKKLELEAVPNESEDGGFLQVLNVRPIKIINTPISVPRMI